MDGDGSFVEQDHDDAIHAHLSAAASGGQQHDVHSHHHHHHHHEHQAYNEQELMPQIERAVNAVNAFNRAPPDNIPVAGPSSSTNPLDPAVLDHALREHDDDDGTEDGKLMHHGSGGEDDVAVTNGGASGDDLDAHSQSGSRKKRKLKPSAPRTGKACLVCRRQKMRCEGADNPPCKRCRNGGHQCVFETNKKDYLKEIKDAGSWQRQVENKIEALQHTLNSILEALERNGMMPVVDGGHHHDQQLSPAPDHQVVDHDALDQETAEQQAAAYIVDPHA